jgi:hypothetical protein
MHFSKKIGMKLGFSMAFYEWILKPILDEIGGSRPTRLGGLCGLNRV